MGVANSILCSSPHSLLLMAQNSNRIQMEPLVGFEPTSGCLQDSCTANCARTALAPRRGFDPRTAVRQTAMIPVHYRGMWYRPQDLPWNLRLRRAVLRLFELGRQIGSPARIRTWNIRINSATLLPVELPGNKIIKLLSFLLRTYAKSVF